MRLTFSDNTVLDLVDSKYSTKNEEALNKMSLQELSSVKTPEFLPETLTTKVICDFDDVLVNITIKWFLSYLMLKNSDLLKDEYYRNFLDHPELIPGRKDYYLQNLFKEEDREKYSKEFLDWYTNDEKFYDNLELTAFGKTIADLEEAGVISLVIISHSFDNHKAAKAKFIAKHFPNAICFTPSLGESKAKIIIEEGHSNFGTFCDDSVKNIVDFLNYPETCLGKEFIMPRYGFNGEETFDKESCNKLSTVCRLSYYNSII